MQQKHKGAWEELTASLWLMSQGFDVFRNVSQHGEIDLIARHPETKETLFIDVTSGSYYLKQDGTLTLNHAKKDPKDAGISVLVVDPDGHCFWSSQGAASIPAADRHR